MGKAESTVPSCSARASGIDSNVLRGPEPTPHSRHVTVLGEEGYEFNIPVPQYPQAGRQNLQRSRIRSTTLPQRESSPFEQPTSKTDEQRRTQLWSKSASEAALRPAKGFPSFSSTATQASMVPANPLPLAPHSAPRRDMGFRRRIAVETHRSTPDERREGPNRPA
ncbi:hypothetical protein PspLS_09879 [Pyricularia sp. CBS 133598]|nr:hypothetical protein PspLS_09879 [Pyricularia sp. CBS 133598]